MDPLTIATAVATATTALYTASNILSTFVGDAKDVDKTLRTILSDVESLLKILDIIKNVLLAPSTQPTLESVEGYGILWSAIFGSVKSCGETAMSIQDILGKIMKGTVSKTFVAKSIRQVRFLKQKQDIDTIQVRVNAHKTNLQLSLHTMNTLVSQVSSNNLTESIGPKVDDLWRQLSRSKLVSPLDEPTGAQHPGKSNDTDLSRRAIKSRGSHTAIILGDASCNSLPEYEEYLAPPAEAAMTAEWSDDGSGDELELEMSTSLMAKGVELCDQQKFIEAEATLQNSLQAIQHISTLGINAEYIKRVQLKLAIAYLYQEKLNQAEEILLYLTTDSARSNLELICRNDAFYYLAQIYLARHKFDSALKACKEARSGRRKVLGKDHKSYYQSVVLLVLIYKTSNDQPAATSYAKTIPANFLSDKGTIAVLRFTSEGSGLSLDGESAAKKLLSEIPYDSTFPNRETNLGLRWAAGQGHKSVVQLLLWRGVNPESPSIDSVTPLMSAAGNGHEEIVQLLLNKGADINSASNDRTTALNFAARNGHELVVRVLLERGAQFDHCDRNGASTLMGPAREGHDGTVKLLLERGVPVNVRDEYGRTALMYAAREGQDSTVALLLRAGADVYPRDERKSTALTYAQGHTAVLQILQDAGAVN